MQRARRILTQGVWQLAFFAWLLLAFSPRAFAFWQCEGQVCAPAGALCCCLAPQDAPYACGEAQARGHETGLLSSGDTTQADANCDSRPNGAGDAAPRAVEGGQRVASLVDSCHCTKIVREAGSAVRPSPVVAQAAPPLFVLVELPRAPYLLAVESFTELPRPEGRGPPARAGFASLPTLRGPPALSA